ncbi:Protein spire like [Forsythia ovata]|uniref:Protein spire like n=1 Tax=Forsythia ovata TaxID=205694 RepID=A0ABD1TPD1_9LAMI
MEVVSPDDYIDDISMKLGVYQSTKGKLVKESHQKFLLFSNSHINELDRHYAFVPTVTSYLISPLTTSRRIADRKVGKFEKNITKRGIVPEASTKKGNNYPVGPVFLGFFVFVVIGSSLFQITRTATSGGMA